MSDDPEYDAMLKSERRTKRIFKQRHYRLADVKCCENCAHVDYGYEGERNCGAIDSEWGDHSVAHLGICDAWEEQRALERKEGE